MLDVRRAVLAAITTAAVVGIGVIVPTAATAAPRHHNHSTKAHASRHAAALTPAQHTLVSALRADRLAYRTAVGAAKAAFSADSTVIAAKASFDAAVAAASNPSDILVALNAFDTTIAGAKGTLAASIQTAADARWTADDAAFAAYDAVANPTTAGAGAAFRLAVHTAAATREAAIKAARDTFRTNTLPARAQLIWDVKQAAGDESAIGVADAAFEAATATDEATFDAAKDAAMAQFKLDLAAAVAGYDAATGLTGAPAYPFLRHHGEGFGFGFGHGQGLDN